MIIMKSNFALLIIITLTISGCAPPGFASEPELCGDEGVWVQVLGAGGPELDDLQASTSYLVWVDGKARLLVDTGPGSSVQFGKSLAKFEDLHAIVFTHLHVDHSADFPSFIKGSYFADRSNPLPVYGPTGNETMPSTTDYVDKMIGSDGVYRYLSDFLTDKSSGGYRITAQNVPASGTKRWSQPETQPLRLSAIPVHHGIIPAVAWRVDVGDRSIVFTGDFNNANKTVAMFARDADTLVIHHAIPEGAGSGARSLHVTPSQIGQVASDASVRLLIVSHHMNRTLSKTALSRTQIEKTYGGEIFFASDMTCRVI